MRQRLDAWLCALGHGTRSQARKLIRKGRVLVDGLSVRDAGMHVEQEAQISIDGQLQQLPSQDFLHVIMHKPAGFACSDDPREEPLVKQLLPAEWLSQGLQSIGRLDRDSTGLLLFTNDGQLLHRLIHPKRKVVKRYRVVYRGRLDAQAQQRFAAGMHLTNDPKPCRPAILQVGDQQTATVFLYEGRYHQVKRMFACCGAEVTSLHRDRLGALDLPADLEPGMMRICSAEEIAAAQQAGLPAE